MATVVITEDDADLRELFGRALSRAGHRVVACPDGDSALARIRDHQPDLVITDVDMPPGMSGLDLLVAVRSNPGTAVLPVIVVTGAPISGRTAGLLGATGVLYKPVSLHTVLAHVDAALDSEDDAGPAASRAT